MAMRRNGVIPNYTPLNSPGSGTTFLLTAASNTRKVQFIVDRIPTRQGSMHNYVQYLEVRALVPITQPTAGASVITGDKLYKLMRAFELRSNNKLGTLWSAGNTSGARLGLVDDWIAAGYEAPFVKPTFITDTAGAKYVELKWVIPFALGVGEKPHHFAPHAALVNDAQLDLFFDTSTVFGGDSTGATVGDIVVSVTAYCEWEFEARLHTPVKWGIYQPQGQGSIQRHKLLGMGGAEGLHGVRDTMGLVGLCLLCDPGTAGSSGLAQGGPQAQEITQVQATFLGIPTLEYPQTLPEEFMRTVGAASGSPQNADPSLIDPRFRVFPHFDDGGGITWQSQNGNPYVGSPLNSAARFYPLRMPPRALELSKVEEVTGTHEVMLNFTTARAETTFQYASLEVGEWSEEFKREALVMILGNDAAKHGWAHKFTKKQRPDEAGNIHVPAEKSKYLPLVAVAV